MELDGEEVRPSFLGWLGGGRRKKMPKAGSLLDVQLWRKVKLSQGHFPTRKLNAKPRII